MTEDKTPYGKRKCDCGADMRVMKFGEPPRVHAFDCPMHFDKTNRRLAGFRTLDQADYPVDTCMYCGKPDCDCQEVRNMAMNKLIDDTKLAVKPKSRSVGQVWNVPAGGFADSVMMQKAKLDQLADDLTEEFKSYDPYNNFGRHFYPAGYAHGYIGHYMLFQSKKNWYDKMIDWLAT